MPALVRRTAASHRTIGCRTRHRWFNSKWALAEDLPIVIAGGDHADVPITPGAGEAVARLVVEENLSLVIDLSAFRKGEQNQFMTDFAEALYHLTDREREVVVAVAHRSSNAEIAEELFIEPATVKSHVASILTKLGLRDRAQVVVFANESGLVEAGDRDIGH
jgi:DNA-binding CsgD family transcriptional regulator